MQRFLDVLWVVLMLAALGFAVFSCYQAPGPEKGGDNRTFAHLIVNSYTYC